MAPLRTAAFVFKRTNQDNIHTSAGREARSVALMLRPGILERE